MTTQTATESKTRRWPWIVAVVAALFVGVGIGAAAGTDIEPAAVETPEPETIIETVVETETVEIVPAACQTYVTWLEDTRLTLLAGLLQIATILDDDGYLVTSEYVDIMDGMSAVVEGYTAGSPNACS